MNRITLGFGAFVAMLLLTEAYPIFGTKRYHRASSIPLQLNPIPIYTAVPQYYDYSPYEAQYQAYGLPIYHGEYKPTQYYYAQGPSYSYYDDRGEDAPNPMDHLHEEMLQEDERERFHENSLPIGQETWYAEPAARQPDSLANANAAFLRNLIAYNSQMNAAAAAPEQNDDGEFEEYSDFSDGGGYFDSPQVDTYSGNFNPYEASQRLNGNLHEDEDDDVQELKHLAYEKEHQNPHATIHKSLPTKHQPAPVQDSWRHGNEAAFHQYDSDPEYEDEWINWDSKRSVLPIKQKDVGSILAFSDRKPSNLVAKHKEGSTVAPPVVTPNAKEGKSGQKEVVLPRPATPVNQPFTASAMKYLKQQADVASSPKEENSKDTTKRSPGKGKQSVYDTIKHLIAMEHSLEESAQKEQQQLNRLKKRFVTNEESLVQQLDGLKRMAA
ncbi:uncharacterized protein LOC129791344 [Lutzomyia longipalpis]|uniref:uncharacterized protein LOC129791344 n=1 Tax=Lutzomyia longipalpis TaxID=7200 RepID=UPI0024841E79|nr:uncharacterized protein LOC129791344 [Lutzomyia longipalpis]